MDNWKAGPKFKSLYQYKKTSELDINTQTLYDETKNLLSNISRWRAGVLEDQEYNDRLINHARLIYWLALERLGEDRTPPDDQGERERFILDTHALMGGMKQCIDAHGPITRQWVRSAAKRVRAILKYRARIYRRAAHYSKLEDKFAAIKRTSP